MVLAYLARRFLSTAGRPKRTMRVLGQHTPRGIFLVDDFVGEDEGASLVGVADGVLGKRKYEGRHWDSVIQGFRECERTVGELCRDLDARAEGHLRAVADRVAVQVEQVDPLATLREQIERRLRAEFPDLIRVEQS